MGRTRNTTLEPDAEYVEIYDVPIGLTVFMSFCYGIVSLVAIAGNVLVLWIILTSRRMQTVTNFFIGNLAVADVIIGIFSIPFQFQAALLQYWCLPEFMCPLCPFVQVLSVNVSVFSLTAIALERYRAIMYPLKPKTTKYRVKISIILIWFVAATSAVPYAMALRVTMIYDTMTFNFTKPFCKVVDFNPVAWKIYNHSLVVLQYLLPLCIIVYVYGRMGLRLREENVPGNSQEARDAGLLRNKRKVIKMLVIVVGLFAFCWLPLQSYNVFQDIFPQINEYKYINVLWFAAHWLAMSNSCYNPFVYAIYNNHFQKVLRDRFPCWNRSRQPNLYRMNYIVPKYAAQGQNNLLLRRPANHTTSNTTATSE